MDIQFSILPDICRPLLGKFYRAHRSAMRAPKEAQVWVARQQEIVGALCLRPVAGGCWLTGLFVAPEVRGQAIASRLLDAALAQTVGTVWLFCDPELLGFYARAGFAETTDLPQSLAEKLRRYEQSKRLIALVYTRPVGAELAREGVSPDSSTVADPAHSRASSLPPGVKDYP